MHYGLDIGGTKIETARFNRELQQLDSTRITTPVDNCDDFISAIVDQVNEADKKRVMRILPHRRLLTAIASRTLWQSKPSMPLLILPPLL